MSTLLELGRELAHASLGARCEVTWPSEAKSLATDAYRQHRCGRAPYLGFTREEWVAFLAGVRAGEFDPAGGEQR